MDSGEKHLARASKGFQFWKCGQQEIQKCFNWDDVFKPLTLSIHLREKRNVLFLYHLLCPCPRPQLSNDANYNAGNSIRTRRRVWGKSWLLPPPSKYNISHLPHPICDTLENILTPPTLILFEDKREEEECQVAAPVQTSGETAATQWWFWPRDTIGVKEGTLGGNLLTNIWEGLFFVS